MATDVMVPLALSKALKDTNYFSYDFPFSAWIYYDCTACGIADLPNA